MASAEVPEQPPRRERERRRHEQEILDAALELFAQQGYERTGMQQIAERAEFSIGKLYQHFDGKEAIYRQLMERHTHDLLSQMDEACDPALPPLANVHRMLAAAIGHFDRHRKFLVIYSNENPMNLEGMKGDAVRRTLARTSELLGQAMARGDIAREDPELVAAVVIGAAERLSNTLLAREPEQSFESVPDLIDRMILVPLQKRAKRRKDGRAAGPAAKTGRGRGRRK